MTAHFNTQASNTVGNAAHVVSIDAARARRAERAYQQSVASSGATTFGQPIAPVNEQEIAAVTAVAQRYDNFLDALLPMVMAADRTLTAQSAMIVAEAVMMSPQLRAQAEGAFAQAHAEK